MSQKVLFITPPFTQLNTPYPATTYLKGFLNTQEIESNQVDLGIEAILSIFSKRGLTEIFDEIGSDRLHLSDNSKRIISLKTEYIETIDLVIRFLQNQNPTLAHTICQRTFLPEASRFNEECEDLEWAFGTMGLHDQARHLATLYLEDLSDLIVECIDPLFGFSRYAEKLGRCATSFDRLYERLNEPDQLIDRTLTNLLEDQINKFAPSIVAITVPFPGNLYGALKCGQFLKKTYPHLKIIVGGGYPNTELRTLAEKRIFEFVDFITLDDGETPVLQIIRYLDNDCSIDQLRRTFTLTDQEVCYIDNTDLSDTPQFEVGTPDYSDLPLNKYLSVIEIVNPMHRLWSDGRWNKLTLAHGCYWGKCTFCDTTLDYIRRYEPNRIEILCDRIETIIEQTGQNGFHFVDEAAPPALLKELAIEILRRGIRIVWWTNIRFEKSYTNDLCRLLKASGCIAVSGGLEVASDRLLKLINKGVSVSQVANVANHFTQNNIMVHAYLMYGFPTQSERETIDSLEMVRQLFQEGVLQSGFWHLFTLTAHSPIGQAPADFEITKENNIGKFANNDLIHHDPKGADHQKFGDGLRKALYNYMHETGFDMPLSQWFDFKVPPTTIPSTFIKKAIAEKEEKEIPLNKQLIWIGNAPQISLVTKNKKGKTRTMARLLFHQKEYDLTIELPEEIGKWLCNWMAKAAIKTGNKITVEEMKADFESMKAGEFAAFWNSSTMHELRDSELVIC